MLESLNNNKKLLPRQAAEQIIKLIRENQLQAGEKLPNEFDMAQQLSVGRGTIREAVKILESRNIVEIRRGRGTFVCEHPGLMEDPLGLALVEDKERLALDLCEVRLILEPELAALAAQRAGEKEIRKLEVIQEQIEKLCRQGESYLKKDMEFHELLARISRNSVMPRLVPIIQEGVSLFIEVTELSLAEETLRTHRKIVTSIQDHDSQGAREAMKEHLLLNQKKIQEKIWENKSETFIDGAKEGFSVAVRIIPYLVAMLVGIAVFRASGAMDYVVNGLAYVCGALGLNTDFVPALPTALLKPLSGSGARAMMIETMQTYGADSFAGFVSCIVQGSTETTFYVLAVYFGSVKITKTGAALPCALLADAAGIIAAICFGYMFY